MTVFRVRLDAAYTRIGAVIRRANLTFGHGLLCQRRGGFSATPHINGWAQCPTLNVDGGLPGGPGRLNGGGSRSSSCTIDTYRHSTWMERAAPPIRTRWAAHSCDEPKRDCIFPNEVQSTAHVRVRGTDPNRHCPGVVRRTQM